MGSKSISLLFLLLAACATQFVSSQSEACQYLKWVNEARAQESRPPMKLDDRLNRVGFDLAVCESKLGSLDHACGGSMMARIMDSLKSSSIGGAAENTAMNGDFRGSFDSLMNSPPHRANIMGDYTYMGYGRFGDWHGQDFANIKTNPKEVQCSGTSNSPTAAVSMKMSRSETLTTQPKYNPRLSRFVCRG